MKRIGRIKQPQSGGGDDYCGNYAQDLRLYLFNAHKNKLIVIRLKEKYIILFNPMKKYPITGRKRKLSTIQSIAPSNY